MFTNRQDAGRQLAVKLKKYQGKNAVIYALPRGGVVTAKEVAKELNLPLDLIIVRKIGHPINPEYAIGAINEKGEIVGDPTELSSVDPLWLKQKREEEMKETRRRHDFYLIGRKPINVKNKIVVIVDDGIATGWTMMAATRAMKDQKPKKIVVAVPVSSSEAIARLKDEADEFITLESPETFWGAIGSYYENFDPVSDDEVLATLQDPRTLLFCQPNFIEIAKDLYEIQGVEHGDYLLEKFANKEIGIRLRDEVNDTYSIILGSITPSSDQFLEFFFLAHTLKKEGAAKIIAILPYLAYMRQDRDKPLESQASDFVAAIFMDAHLDNIVTIDIHSEMAKSLFKVPILSLSSAKLWAEEIKKIGFENATVVAPDEGAIHRAEALKLALGKDEEIVYFKKRRLNEKMTSTIHGEVTSKAIIVDDILDTGATLINACDALVKEGVKEIVIMVTHGLFTGEYWKALFDLKVSKIFTTDSVPETKLMETDKIIIISVGPLVTDYLEKEINYLAAS